MEHSVSAQVETFADTQEEITVSLWPNTDARHLVILAHGYGEHLGRYEHVAQFLVERGAAVAGRTMLVMGARGASALRSLITTWWSTIFTRSLSASRSDIRACRASWSVIRWAG
jgi:Serine aminopeptidase, S33